MKKIVLLAFVLVFLSRAVIVGFVRPAVAQGTIYIKADGSVEGTDKITNANNITYTFTENINDSIIVERSKIIIDGNGYTLNGLGSLTYGFNLTSISNVKIRNVNIVDFGYAMWLEGASQCVISNNTCTNNEMGIRLDSSSNNSISGNIIAANKGTAIGLDYSSNNNSISGNNITNNDFGIRLDFSSNNSISGNIIAANNWTAIGLGYSSNNRIVGNNITANHDGFWLAFSSNNIISGNKITNKEVGIFLLDFSSNNSISGNIITNNLYGIYLERSESNEFYHNNFIENRNQTYVEPGYANSWDKGYPSGGNYWSDYEDRYPNATEIDNSGMWDTPYVIDENNQDNYPLVPEFPTWTSMLLILILLTVSIAIYKRRLLKTPAAYACMRPCGVQQNLYDQTNLRNLLLDNGRAEEKLLSLFQQLKGF